MKLIGLTGHAGVGKDTVANILCREHGFAPVSFADPLRQMLYALNPLVQTYDDVLRLQPLVDAYGWDRAKRTFPEIRMLLQRMGTEAGRHVLGDSVWVDMGMATAKQFPYAVLTDVRFVNEALAIKARGGEIWRVTRPGVIAVNGHVSDTGLPDDLITRTIVNDGDFEDLALAVFGAVV